MHLIPMPEIFCGSDALEALGTTLAQVCARRVFIVTGPHVSRTDGFAAMKAVAEKGRDVAVFNETQGDPSMEQVTEMIAQAKAFGADAVIGMGGGSPIDAAKVVAAALSNDRKVEEMVGTDRVPKRCAPLFIIPTTAGTGSEATNISILTDTAEQMKKAVVSNHILPHMAFLVPELTVSMPKRITATTGIDAFCHATEAYLSKRRNPYSDGMALRALGLIARWLEKACCEPENLAAREGMLMASFFAGLAFTNASVTAIHAFAYPLGGRYHTPHGMANALMLAPVLKHNFAGNEERFADLAEAFCGARDPGAFVPAVQVLKKNIGLPMSLDDAGIPESDLESMAEAVMGVTRLLEVNPNAIVLDDARRIYQEAFKGE
ncbi:iron-containing alcohol dehydrogenase family protein [Pontiella agarivorans]|uniref:Iron-containing alcohol dehydrogenase n=1 Tax=Pontiella agarivorans TaxID=3038953 RepID=A0ABU5MXM4_9BACT|nr:iron-containing alcohol dehydrogenase [Pontiella agarivorans]MDZ8118971.1 iron-containing alcohol dehydrogenase [Pontiella agarivorans]